MSVERRSIKRRYREEEYSDEDFEYSDTPSFNEHTPKSKGNSHLGHKHSNGTDSSHRSARQDNSLGVLTKKFVSLIQNAENKCIDLNEAVSLLNVQKRRIYDITNVLEGIGLIQKRHKNKIQWVGGTEGSEQSHYNEAANLNRELESLTQEEQKLDYWIAQLQESLNQMTKDPAYAEYAYVTYDDIKSLNNLTGAENETLLAIRAPPGTSLEVPDPESFPEDERERYQIYLQSRSGEILVYVVSNEKPNFSPEAEPRVLSTNTYRLSNPVADELRDRINRENSLKHEAISDLFSL